MRRALGVVAVVVLLAVPVRAHAQPVDTWRILHVGLQSGIADDTDGDGTPNTWGRSTRDLWRKWQYDMACLDPVLDAESGGQIAVDHDWVFIETGDPVKNTPWAMEAAGYEASLDFESYDVVMVWTGYSQALGFDGGAWNGVTGGYSYIALYGMAGACPRPNVNPPWPGAVPAHEFVHAVTGLYFADFPVCGTYDYVPWTGTEWEHHMQILTNTFPVPITCADGDVSTGVPPEAWASGSWTELR